MTHPTPQPLLTQRRTPWLGLFLALLLPLLTLTALTACANQPNPDETRAEALLAQAATQEAEGDVQGAMQTLQEISTAYGTTDTAVAAQQQLSRLLLAEAEAQRTAGNYPAALQAYGGITDPARLAEADTAVVETYRAWVAALLAEGDLATAETQLNTLASLRGDDPETATLRAQLALAKGEAAVQAGDIASAYVNYIAVLSQSPAQIGTLHNTAVDSFRTNLAQPLMAYASERAAAEDYSKATLALEAIAQYGPPDLTDSAQTQAAEMTLRWGEVLWAGEDYPGAIEKFAYIRAFYPESDVAATAVARLVDVQVAQVQASGLAGELPAPEASASGTDGAAGTAVYRVQNDTPCPIVILLSGAQSQALQLAPTAVGESTFTAGAYAVVVQPDTQQTLSDTCRDIIPFLGQYDLADGTVYTSRFFVAALEE